MREKMKLGKVRQIDDFTLVRDYVKKKLKIINCFYSAGIKTRGLIHTRTYH